MAHTKPELESLLLGNPLNDSLRVQLENLLQQTEPGGVDVELLRRERQIAEALDRGEPIDALIHEWLTSFNRTRTFALNLAIEHKLRHTFDLHSLPIEIARGHLLGVFETKYGIIDVVRRYRGPTGKEPDLTDGEIEIRVLATHCGTPDNKAINRNDRHSGL